MSWAEQRAAADALRQAFDRLAPQGSDPWNFLAAFTHLGNRYGPYQPGGSGSSELLAPPATTNSAGARLRRLRQRVDGSGSPDTATATELEEAMGHVVEAFRFLSARVRTLEERLSRQDEPLYGPAWLLPAAALGEWVSPVVAHLLATTPGGDLWHGDCGDGALLRELEKAGAVAQGNEPRGAVALTALEDGRQVEIAETLDALVVRPPASLGGLVLSGVVDRLPLHALIRLLSEARRTLALGAPLVVIATEPSFADQAHSAAARELLQPQTLQAATWDVLLDRAGFVSIAPLLGPDDPQARFALVASTPT